MKRKTDERLVEKFLRSHDEAAFRELYRRHTPALYAFALRLCGGSESDAQDLIQETWIRACSVLPRFQWKSELRTWLTGVLINCGREASRRRGPDHEADVANGETWEPGNQGGEKLNLEQAIDRLSPGYRYVLALHDIEGYTHDEISRLLNISVGTSKSQLHHARAAIRASLKTETQKQ